MNFSGGVDSDFMKLSGIPLAKRPTLINFAGTDFLTLRDSLIDYAQAVYPLEYEYFVESDLGMMFIELIAYMGSVMSLKADMLANENFFATATQRGSIIKLLQLIGVRLRGPLSSAADVQLDFNKSSPMSGDTIITAENRIIETTSPEDGGALTFTLYKVINGLVDTANITGQITLNASEAEGANKDVYSNLVMQEGALVTDGGEFAATEAVKIIKLSQSPVVDGSVEVFITAPTAAANGAYNEVPNVFYASGASDKIFEIVYDENFAATVVFGNGSVGISPDDTASYFVSYRIGGGTRGNIIKNAINTSIISDKGVGTLKNTSVGAGGANAETVDHAKRYAPLTFRRQDRIVTLEDYASFANSFISDFGTIGKAAAATRTAYASANIIDIYILEMASDLQLQRATSNFKTQLLTAINKKKMATDDVVIVDGLIRTLELITTIRVDREEQKNQDQIISQVRREILNYMSVDNMEFGGTLVLADLNRIIFEVPQVRWSSIDNFSSNITVDFNEIIQLNNLTINVELVD